MPDANEKTTRTVCVPGMLRVMERVNPYEFKVHVDIMREGVNNNQWDYRNLKKHYKTFLGQPILIAYVGGKIGDGHNMREIIKPDGGREYTFTDGTAERIIGVLSEDESDFTLQVREDGNLWLTASGKIFTFYAREAVEKIIAAGAMDVSAETDVFEEKEGPDGIEIFERWAGLGVTILGDDVPPAIPGARIKQLSLIREDMDAMRIKAASMRDAQDKNRQAPAKKREKGVKNTMNKRELAQLQGLVNGYTVLEASEDGNRVCLMNDKDGSFCGYTFDPDDAERLIIPGRIRTMRDVKTVFRFGEGDEDIVMLDASVPTDALAAKVIRLNAENETKDKRIAELENEVKTMRENERVRRIEAAKNAVKMKFRDMNAVRECMFDNELAEKVCQMCDEGRFCEDVDGEGRWCGDKNAVNALLAACMEAQTSMDTAAANKRSKVFNAWSDAMEDGKQSVTNEDQLLAFLEKKGVK